MNVYLCHLHKLVVFAVYVFRVIQKVCQVCYEVESLIAITVGLRFEPI